MASNGRNTKHLLVLYCFLFFFSVCARRAVIVFFFVCRCYARFLIPSLTHSLIARCGVVRGWVFNSVWTMEWNNGRFLSCTKCECECDARIDELPPFIFTRLLMDISLLFLDKFIQQQQLLNTFTGMKDYVSNWWRTNLRKDVWWSCMLFAHMTFRYHSQKMKRIKNKQTNKQNNCFRTFYFIRSKNRKKANT